MSFTESALKQQAKIKKDYPNLIDNYQEFMGNFMFGKKEVQSKMIDILLWLKEHKEFKLIYQHKSYFLTDFGK